MDATRNAEVLAGMRAATSRIAVPVTEFGEALRALDIRIGMHNYEGQVSLLCRGRRLLQ